MASTNTVQQSKAGHSCPSRHTPKKKIKARKDLPWITHDIKNAMKHQRQLYDYAKQYNTNIKKAGVLIVRFKHNGSILISP